MQYQIKCIGLVAVFGSMIVAANAVCFPWLPRINNNLTSNSDDAINDTDRTVDPDANRFGCDLAVSKGYQCTELKVVTDDGYILTVFRLPRASNETAIHTIKKPKPIVFLQHGLEASGTNWIMNFPTQSLGFILADNGYDVWMGNFRGNQYSRAHTTWGIDTKEFWDFSWDQMAQYDLPAMINFALNYTQQEQLFYVGHSEGTMTAFAKFSSDLKFAKKIKKYFALAPIISLKYTNGALRFLALFGQVIGWLFQLFGVYEFLPNTCFSELLAEFVCGIHFTDKLICENLFFALSGPDVEGLNKTRIPVYASHVPSGTATKNIVHFSQLVLSGNFQKYKYPTEQENIDHYGQATAPLYDVTQMEVPTAVFWGGNDWLADPRDFEILRPKIKNLIGNYYQAEMNHLDFIWGMKAATEIYAVILNLMKS